MSTTIDNIRMQAQKEAQEELGNVPVNDAQKLYCRECLQVILKAHFAEHEKQGHVLIDSPELRKTYEKPPVTHDLKSGSVIIQARDAEVGKTYLTVGMHYQIEIVSKLGDDTHISSVTVKSETSPYKPIGIAPSTELIEYRADLHVPITHTSLEGETPMSNEKPPKAEKPAKQPKAPKEPQEPKVKMSDIVNPMLLANKHTAEEIADAVIEKIPEKKSERDKLILQIKGPRLYNLKNDKEACGGKTPGLKASEADKAKAAAKATKPKAEKKEK